MALPAALALAFTPCFVDSVSRHSRSQRPLASRPHWLRLRRSVSRCPLEGTHRTVATRSRFREGRQTNGAADRCRYMTNNTDQQNPEAGRAPSRSEQSLQPHADKAPTSQLRPELRKDKRRYEITFTRTAGYLSVMTVQAQSLQGAEDIAEHILTDASQLVWDRISNEIDILSVDEIEEGMGDE
jgi:hypothetical protein